MGTVQIYNYFMKIISKMLGSLVEIFCHFLLHSLVGIPPQIIISPYLILGYPGAVDFIGEAI